MSSSVNKKLGLPALFLGLAALLNLVTGTALVAIGVQGLVADLREIDSGLQREFPGQHEEMVRSGWSLERWIWNTSTGCLAMGVGGWVTGVLALVGLYRRHRGKGDKLVLAGAILLSVPGLSPTVCVAIGPLAGLWMVLTLLDESGAIPRDSS